jgi:hypothetical protein
VQVVQQKIYVSDKKIIVFKNSQHEYIGTNAQDEKPFPLSSFRPADHDSRIIIYKYG